MARSSTYTRTLALVGCGTIGTLRAGVAAEDRSLDRIVLFDVDPEKSRTLAQRLGPIATAVPSLDDAVGGDDVAGVVVSTSEHQHREPVDAALRAGKPVLVEKPLAHVLRDARWLAARAEETGVALHVGYTQRFRRRYLNAREQIDKGKLGDVTGMLGRRYVSRAVMEKIAKRTDHVTPASDSLTYLVDLCLWYFQGAQPLRVVARSHYLDDPGDGRRQPDATWALLEMDNGAVCNLSVTWQLPKMHPTAFVIGLDIFGDRGFLSIDDSHSDVVMSTELGADLLYTPDVHPQAVFVGTTPAGEWARSRFWGPLRYETQAFLETLVTGEAHPVLASAADACRTLAVTEAMDAASLSGDTEDVGIEYL